jgi:RNA 3'-terminal phosphate cyclase (ATP)
VYGTGLPHHPDSGWAAEARTAASTRHRREAAAAISDAQVAGCEVNSATLVFEPGRVRPGEYSFSIGTAGSCTLVLQTVLPPLLTASAQSVIRISGGTHNKAAPPVDFLNRAFLPLLERMGARVELTLERYGFHPRGGGVIVARITPVARLKSIEISERGQRVRGYAEAYIAGLPLNVAKRELAVIGRRLNWTADQLEVRGLPSDMGPGNAVTITLEHEHIIEVFTGFGEKSRSAESVAEGTVYQVRDYLVHSAPVGEHLADQLLMPMALGGVSAFVTSAPTAHFTSNAEVIAMFTGRRISAQDRGGHHVVSVDR